MAKVPSFPYYPGDWLKDPAVSSMTPASRGIWWDLISRMHENNRSGEVSGTVEQLSRMARCSIAEMQIAIEEIDTTCAGSVTRHENGRRSSLVVTLRNRRMYRSAKARKSSNARKMRQRVRKVTAKSQPSHATSHAAVPSEKVLPSSSSSSSGEIPPHTPPLNGASAAVQIAEPNALRLQLAEAEFERLWLAYPEKGRKAKQLAAREWVRAIAEGFAPSLAEVLDALSAQKRGDQGRRNVWVNLDRWITEKRWADAVDGGTSGDGASARYRQVP